MNKRAIFILGLFTLFFVTAYATTKIGMKEEENILQNEIAVIKEEENVQINEIAINASAEEKEKTTPKTALILKKYYSDCGHTITDNAEMPEDMVNLTEEELKNKYSNWKIEEFSKEKVVLSRESDSFCGEHYLIIEEEGNIVIYILDEEGNKTLKENTEIAVEYLPETDKIILSNGIYVYGTEELNKIKEDFE